MGKSQSSRLRAALVALSLSMSIDSTLANDVNPAAVEKLGSLVGVDTKGVCASLQASFGFDVCAIVHDKPGPFTQSPPPPPTPLSPNDVCLTYDFEAPDGKEDVIEYLEHSLDVAPVPCFDAFVSYCQFDFDNSQERTEAFANWTANYQNLLAYLQTPDAALVGPTCYFILPEEEQRKVQTGQVDVEADICDGLPDVDETTPLQLDWTAQNLVTPVTNQFGGTCFVHATVSWLGSIVLRLGLTDESGQFKLTNAITPSVQPVIDCYFPAVIGKSACYGGDAQTVAEILTVNGTTTDDRYPYKTGEQQDRGGLPWGECVNPDNISQGLCANLRANDTLVYKLPQGTKTEWCKLSQSQLVRFVADNGPTVVSYASGNLVDGWKAYGANETVKLPFGGYIGEPEPSFCSNEVDHAVLMTGYDLTGDAPYLIFKNSWGTRLGLKGYFWAKLSPRDSADFRDPNNNGTCGITTSVLTWKVAG